MPGLGGRRRWLWWWLGAIAAFAVLMIAVLPWGPMISKTYELPADVDRVDINRGTLVVVEDTPGDPYVTVESDIRLVPFVAVSSQAETLHVGFAEGSDFRTAILPLLRWVPATSWTRVEFILHTDETPYIDASHGADHVIEDVPGDETKPF